MGFKITVVFYIASAIALAISDYLEPKSIFLLTLLYAVILAVGSLIPRLNFYLKALHVNPSRKVVITFDDGPDPINTPKILSILKDKDVNAVFFLIGKKALQNPEIVDQILSEGHLIGGHTQNHDEFIGFRSKSYVMYEIKTCQDIIASITGYDATLFRPPFGVTNPIIAKVCKELELNIIGWSVRSFETLAKSKKRLVSRVVKKAHSGSIILLHDRLSTTAEALPDIIDGIHDKGLKFGLFPDHAI